MNTGKALHLLNVTISTTPERLTKQIRRTRRQMVKSLLNRSDRISGKWWIAKELQQ